MADVIDSGKISFACELDKDLETPTTESNTEARITFTETQIVLGLGNDKSIKYKATGQGTDLTNYYNRSEVDEKLKLKADKTQLGDYYNKGEVDSSLGNKVDTTTLTTDYYNKTETDNLLSNKADTTVLENYYNKSDIDGKLTNKVDTTTLDNYDLSTEVDGKVKVVSDKVGDLSTLETGVKNTVVAAINEVKRAQTEAGKVTNLNDLGDVNASSPRRGQFLGWDQNTRKWVSKDVETDGMDTHMADFNNPHRTTISNLKDTTINTPEVNQVLVYNGTKWINKNVSLDDSNYAKKNEANIFTKKQSGIDGTEDANFVTLNQLKTKVGLTGDETIKGNKTFSSPIIIPNATANNHSLPLGQADGRYSKILVDNINWTVGKGGNFDKLSDALSEACKYITINNTYKIVITLKSGYKLNEKIKLFNSLASHITITSEDDEVTVDYDPLEDYLFNFTSCIAPQLSCLFNAEGTTAKGMYFLNSYARMSALNGNQHKFGFINLKMNAVTAYNSKVVLMGYNLSENGKNLNTEINQDILFATSNSELTIFDGKLDNNGSLVNGWLYYCGYNSRLSLLNGSCTNNKSNYNILENNNSYINVQYSNFTGSKGNYLLRGFNGSQTNLNGITTKSCTWSKAELPFTVNTVTKDGIIYK